MSNLGSDEVSSKNVTFYGASAAGGHVSKQYNLRSGAVNLKVKHGAIIPTTDFDELNKLIDGETS